MNTPSASIARPRQPHLSTERRPAPARSWGIPLGRLFGVSVVADWSLLIVFAIIVVNLALAAFPAWHPEWSPVLSWLLAVVAAVLFFASVLAHELSHAVVGRMHGVPIRRITLFIFGGVAHMEEEPRSPKAEFLMAIVGPITSVVIGFVSILLGSMLASATLSGRDIENPALVMRSIGPVATLLLWLGPINILLGLFNLVPGFPLDGGRVLRAVLWQATGDLEKATRWASRAGLAVAWALIIGGGVSMLLGSFAQGLWLILIGWFLSSAARASYQSLVVRRTLEDVPVTRIMRRRLERVPPDRTLDAIVAESTASDQAVFPVEADGKLAGLVTPSDVRKVRPGMWPVTTASEVMTPVARVVTLPPTATADQAMQELARLDVDCIPVVEDGRVLGIVRRSDIVRWLALQQPERGDLVGERSAPVPG